MLLPRTCRSGASTKRRPSGFGGRVRARRSVARRSSSPFVGCRARLAVESEGRLRIAESGRVRSPPRSGRIPSPQLRAVAPRRLREKDRAQIAGLSVGSPPARAGSPRPASEGVGEVFGSTLTLGSMTSVGTRIAGSTRPGLPASARVSPPSVVGRRARDGRVSSGGVAPPFCRALGGRQPWSRRWR